MRVNTLTQTSFFLCRRGDNPVNFHKIPRQYYRRTLVAMCPSQTTASMTKLHSITSVLSALYASQKSHSDILSALVQHVVDAAPSTTFPILAPIRLLISLLDNATREVVRLFGSQLSQGLLCVDPELIEDAAGLFNEDYHQVLDICRQTREELFPAIEMNLTDMEPRLLADLRGSYGIEYFLRFIKHIPGCWSTRIDLLDDIHDIVYSMRSSVQVVMVCLDHVEQYARLVHARLLDNNWVARHRGRSDLCWCLHGIMCSVLDMSYILPVHRQLPGYLPTYVFLVLFHLAVF
ncbi:hypothetical protein EV421DRAFT_164729 [Armillaria borealis]|uniref:Uncharacterized protein n=1 Tax=Armillaria borealis TaxID=47425 RepID=A0AA39IXE0_9AGAR|nr:hypothetical protein EV421DRAFT_164729 [Armillaria borealis]